MAILNFELLGGNHQWPTHTPSEKSLDTVSKAVTDFYGEIVDKLWGWSQDAQCVSGTVGFAERDVEDLFRKVCKARGVKVELTDYEGFSEPEVVTNRRFKLVLRGDGWTHLGIVHFEIETATVYGMNDDQVDGRPSCDLGSFGILIGYDASDEASVLKMARYFKNRQPLIAEAE